MVAARTDDLLVNGRATAPATLILAHGAGAPMDSPFMNTIAQAVASQTVRVVRFEFPYMAARRISGKRGAPDREVALLDAWRHAITAARAGRILVVGGKSLGGRIASMIADDVGAAGLVCLGYPFHPPGNPSRPRVRHLEQLRTPALIVQGTRDSLGRPEEVRHYNLSPRVRIAWIEDGDHSLKPRVRSGRTEAQNLSDAIAYVRDFIASLDAVNR
ncbi:MAG: alpha/beta family hydrolase [Candidatus Binataceae bacterium]